MKDGGPAFPVECYFENGEIKHRIQTGNRSGWTTGMSLRDYFAGQAVAQLVTRTRDRQFVHSTDEMAAQAYEIADAMLAEREKSK